MTALSGVIKALETKRDYEIRRCGNDGTGLTREDGWVWGMDEAIRMLRVFDRKERKSLNEMMSEVVEFEKSKGWVPNDNQFGTSLALLHSEISEALESFRAKDWGSTVDGKPEGVSSELADVLIRLLSTWAQFVSPHDWDLESEYERKMAYNRTRPFRHGGKAV